MRRFVVGSAVLGVFAAALGCQHIGGMNDVYHHPDNAVINTGGTNPYHPTGTPVYGSSVSQTPPVEAKPPTEMKPPMEMKPIPMPKAEEAPKGK